MIDDYLVDAAIDNPDSGVRRTREEFVPLDWHPEGGVMRKVRVALKQVSFVPPDVPEGVAWYRCGCRDEFPILPIDAPPGPVARIPDGRLVLRRQMWAVRGDPDPHREASVEVWLGQCEHCGTIFHRVVRD